MVATFQRALTRAYYHSNHPLLLILLTLTAYASFIVTTLSLHNNDISYFIQAGDMFTDSNVAPEGLTVLENSYGYDGQFYYRLALDPFTTKKTDFGIVIDNPPYRNQRILYPLFTWILSTGNSYYVPIVMIGVNVAFLCLIAYATGQYIQGVGSHVIFGLAVVLYPGFLFSVSRNLTEIVEVSLIILSLQLLTKRYYLFSALAATAAILAKETALLWILSVLIVGIYKQITSGTFRWSNYFFIPLAVYIGWQAFLGMIWGEIPLLSASGNNIGLPFSGILKLVIEVISLDTYLKQLWFVYSCFLLAIAIATTVLVIKNKYFNHESLSWLFYLMLCISLTESVWVEDTAFLRATTEFVVLAVLLLIRMKSKVAVPLTIGVTLLWFYWYTTRGF
ncbi:MAG: hypothetical protein H7Z42_03195 [Roseiflexaceae bacterium]|nr:hypothetical protein [Roseiflexaceae bacterium]